MPEVGEVIDNQYVVKTVLLSFYVWNSKNTPFVVQNDRWDLALYHYTSRAKLLQNGQNIDIVSQSYQAFVLGW